MADPKHPTKQPEHPPAKQAEHKQPDKIPPDPKDAVVRPPPLPVEPTGPKEKGAPVGYARHAESQEEAKAVRDVERADIPPPGSRNYVAGQPVTTEELTRTQDEAARLKEAGRKQRTDDEKRRAENDPFDPDYKTKKAD